jgi:cellulose synthase/poly-beta-1,6-N-acetylglucosamine synthase-like glycosyltransferase
MWRVFVDKKLTVIVPVYNEQKMIGECLDALLHQTLDQDQYEIIMIDNNSTDISAQIATNKGVRVEKELHKGYVHAIRKGVEVSSTEFIAFTDADCRVPENWAEKIVDNFSSSHDIVGVGGKVAFYDVPLVIDKFFQMILYFNSALPGNNMAVRRSALVEMGGIDPRINLSVDYWLTLKLRSVGKLKVDRSLMVKTSARRLKYASESTIKYFINVIALQVASRPLFYDFPDVRH